MLYGTLVIALLIAYCVAFCSLHRSRLTSSVTVKTEVDHVLRTLECSSRVDFEEEPKAYGNRSLSWTEKYRKLFPYEYARRQAMSLGLRSKEEWDDYLADGKVYHGPYLPSRPEEMYAEDWVSWEEFLGIMRDYNETTSIVQNVLHISDINAYDDFIRADPKRAEGLRIPLKPHIVYKDKGWVSFEDFFGSDQSYFR